MPDFKSSLEAKFPDSGTAKKAYRSLIQETEFTKKSRASLNVKGDVLSIRITADNFASLRATVSSYMRLLSVFYSVKEVLEKK